VRRFKFLQIGQSKEVAFAPLEVSCDDLVRISELVGQQFTKPLTRQLLFVAREPYACRDDERQRQAYQQQKSQYELLCHVSCVVAVAQ